MAVIEVAPGATDAAVFDLALRETRIFITEDRDFGQFVYAASKPARGVILLRFPSNMGADLPATLIEFFREHPEKVVDRFVVVQPGRIRVGRTPIS